MAKFYIKKPDFSVFGPKKAIRVKVILTKRLVPEAQLLNTLNRGNEVAYYMINNIFAFFIFLIQNA